MPLSTHGAEFLLVPPQHPHQLCRCCQHYDKTKTALVLRSASTGLERLYGSLETPSIGAEERPHRAPPSTGTALPTRPRQAPPCAGPDPSRPRRLQPPPEPPHPAADPSHQHRHAAARASCGKAVASARRGQLRRRTPRRGLHALLLRTTPTPRAVPSSHAPSAPPQPRAAASTSDPSAATGPPTRATVLPRVADRPRARCSPRHLAALAGRGATTRRSCRVTTGIVSVPAWSPAVAILAARTQLYSSRALRQRRGGWEGRRG
jgi:hypothetical protein